MNLQVMKLIILHMSKVELFLRSVPNCRIITYTYKDYKPSLYQLEFALYYII